MKTADLARGAVGARKLAHVSKEAVATCPAGEVLVGGGGAIPNVGVIVASDHHPTQWRVIGMRAGSSTAPRTLTARAICARA